jgi:hypothetical protein
MRGRLYLPGITHPNLDKTGKVFSTDYGICQWNDVYHGKEITPEEALHDPEKAVRLMCQYVKQGLIKQWVCYSTGCIKSLPRSARPPSFLVRWSPRRSRGVQHTTLKAHHLNYEGSTSWFCARSGCRRVGVGA